MVDSHMRFATCATPARHENHVMSHLPVEHFQAGQSRQPTCDADFVVACCSHNTYSSTPAVSSCDYPRAVAE